MPYTPAERMPLRLRALAQLDIEGGWVRDYNSHSIFVHTRKGASVIDLSFTEPMWALWNTGAHAPARIRYVTTPVDLQHLGLLEITMDGQDIEHLSRPAQEAQVHTTTDANDPGILHVTMQVPTARPLDYIRLTLYDTSPPVIEEEPRELERPRFQPGRIIEID